MIAAVKTNLCYACGGVNFREMQGIRDAHSGTQRRYDLYVCTDCGSARLAMLPTSEAAAQLYPPDYYSYRSAGTLQRIYERVARRFYRRHRFRPVFSRLLEIGCGNGEFLASIQGEGEAIGLERPGSVIQAKPGVRIMSGDVCEASLFSAASFDYIYLSHAFEHLEDPAAALRSIATWLEPGGRLFIGIPNFASATARLFGPHWYYLGPPAHITNSTPAGVRAALERAGLIVERIDYNSDFLSIPLSSYIALGGDIRPQTPLLVKLMLVVLGFVCIPLTWALDKLKRGDCIEVHARKPGIS